MRKLLKVTIVGLFTLLVSAVLCIGGLAALVAFVSGATTPFGILTGVGIVACVFFFGTVLILTGN